MFDKRQPTEYQAQPLNRAQRLEVLSRRQASYNKACAASGETPVRYDDDVDVLDDEAISARIVFYRDEFRRLVSTHHLNDGTGPKR